MAEAGAPMVEASPSTDMMKMLLGTENGDVPMEDMFTLNPLDIDESAFGQYVDELGRRQPSEILPGTSLDMDLPATYGMSTAVPALAPVSGQGMSLSGGSGASAVTPGLAGAVPSGQQVPVPYYGTGPVITSGTQPQHQAAMEQPLGAAPMQEGRGDVDVKPVVTRQRAGKAADATKPSSSGHSAAAGAANDAGEDPNWEVDSDDEPERAAGGSGRRSGTRGVHKDTKTKRNARQQQQNKAAQQRYRERRKHRFVEMEQAIEALTAQTEDMGQLRTQNDALQGKASALEQALGEREAEIQRLKLELLQQRRVHEAEEAAEREADASGEEGVGAEEHAQRRAQREEELRLYQQHWSNQVRRLQAFVQQHALRSVNPLGIGVDPAIIQEVAKLVSGTCSTCSKAMRAEGIKVLELMSKDLGQMSHITCARQCAHWTKTLECLQLSAEQQEKLMTVRRKHLNSLRALYQERQDLNMQAMGLMLPRSNGCDNGTQASRLGGLDSKLDCMSLNGYMYVARTHVDLNSVLDQIKDNLRKEQRIVMELNAKTLNHILSPIQCALFFVEAYPAHCDCLALANILAKRLHREDSFDRTGSGSQNGLGKAADRAVNALTSNGSGHQHSDCHSEKSESCAVRDCVVRD